MIHGIAVRNRKTGDLVDFLKCNLGREALTILGGVRHNLHPDLYATEDFVSEEELNKIGKKVEVK